MVKGVPHFEAQIGSALTAFMAFSGRKRDKMCWKWLVN
jgi:hypothetical protein